MDKPLSQWTEQEIDGYLQENVFFCGDKILEAEKLTKGWCIEPQAYHPKYLWRQPEQVHDCHDYCSPNPPDNAIEAKREVVRFILVAEKLSNAGKSVTPSSVFEAMKDSEWLLRQEG